MRSYLVYLTLNIIFIIVENMVKKNRIHFFHCGSFDHLDL
jgi:hypothetical protein